jgi:uncharacterized protein (DUF1778 family)
MYQMIQLHYEVASMNLTKTINLRDLPDDLVRKAKACAALHGLTLKDFVLRAIEKATEEDLPFSTAGALAATVQPSKRRARKA